jgi:hypothetical protein
LFVMDQLLAAYGSDDEEDVKDQPPTNVQKPSTPPPASTSTSPSTSTSSQQTTTDKGKKRIAFTLPIDKEALKGDYRKELTEETKPQAKSQISAASLSAILPAPKNVAKSKQQQQGAPPSKKYKPSPEEEVSDETYLGLASSDTSETTSTPTTTTTTPGTTPTTKSVQSHPAFRRTIKSIQQVQKSEVTSSSSSSSTRKIDPKVAAYFKQDVDEGPSVGPQRPPSSSPSTTEYTEYTPYPEVSYEASGPSLPAPPPELARDFADVYQGAGNANFVEVHQAAIVDKSGWSRDFEHENMMKFQQAMATQSGWKPSQVQRQRHQITALAYEAKQKEWELNYARSRSARTKAETYGKYGW